MAFSAEPSRTTAYSDDIRWRVIWQKLVRELSFVQIAQNLNIAVGTAYNIWSRFVHTGEVSAKKQPPRQDKRKLDDYQELLLTGLVLEQPHLYISEMRQHILDTTGVDTSNATICRILGKHGLTRQKMRQVALQRCTELRAKFRAEMCFFSIDKFVWIDETGCDKKSAIRKAGYGLRGITPEYHRKLAKGKRLSSVAAISVEGVIAVDFTHDSVNAEHFYDFARGSLIPNLLPFDGQNPRSVVIMDNCSIHHVDYIKQLFRDAGVLVIFLPPYSPDINPIEHTFSKVKKYLRRHDELVQAFNDITPIVRAAFDTVTGEDCRGWIQHCGYQV